MWVAKAEEMRVTRMIGLGSFLALVPCAAAFYNSKNKVLLNVRSVRVPTPWRLRLTGSVQGMNVAQRSVAYVRD